jgi:hypothetical protein
VRLLSQCPVEAHVPLAVRQLGAYHGTDLFQHRDAQISHSGVDVLATAPNLSMLASVGLLIWPSLTAALLHGRKRRRYMTTTVVADVAQR